jgi:hypothetical protein
MAPSSPSGRPGPERFWIARVISLRAKSVKRDRGLRLGLQAICRPSQRHFCPGGQWSATERHGKLDRKAGRLLSILGIFAGSAISDGNFLLL